MSDHADPVETASEQAGQPLAPVAQAPVAAPPSHIGRYRVERLLGEGSFGQVYLAHDDHLNRPVAVKVPHRRLVARPEDAEAYLTEARTVAHLDHPHIVPVFDVGSTQECPFFFVSKYIEGRTLAQQIREDRPAVRPAAELVATVAEALHYAHCKGLVHRDVKPGNILLDTTGQPHVADFGLALKEENLGQGPKFAGTPAYMSPEQARSEGHRVDGRSDIFSLGVVFYELLAGRLPFRADAQAELLEQITTYEPRPLRQIDEHIPKELERICLKALSKRAAERYLTAKDLADDLRHFLAEPPVHQPSASAGRSDGSPSARAVVQPASTPSSTSWTAAPTPASGSQPIKIVPKGLRSFDAQDADFFLELLPGPRDRDGLPDSIRFWKRRIEEADPDHTFAVGLIYGPSGCGKSSLVKAGLLPRLSENVLAVYIESTAGETETRLLNGLRKRCPALPSNLALRETLVALRRGQGLPTGKKLLIVLDQFEQWLHANKDEPNTELVQALRQCDGGRVQCVVMVRDDFWLGVSRFLRELEVRLVEGQNSALADLFDGDHAQKVLAAFGRAFGKLPANPGATSKEHKDFLKEAVKGLAQEGKIVCVRLALFAEMMKGKPWTPASLRAAGGTEGVGVTFLEETFGAATAPPEHRYHQKAARAVLKALLPATGTDLKGHMRSDAELLSASGYGSRPRDFDDLIRILDSETRLITPTDPEGKDAADLSWSQGHAGQKYYQLTHDYLVHSLRDWLARKQKETRRGRAELMLVDRASVWNARPENRQLPSLPQWVSIRLLTPKKSWTEPQRKMMRQAGRHHAVRFGALTVLLLVLAGTGLGLRNQVLEKQNYSHAEGLVHGLLVADLAKVPGIVTQLEAYRAWADPLLRQNNEEAGRDSSQKLNISLALLPVDPVQRDYLYNRLLDAEPHQVAVLRDALAPHQEELRGQLWAVLEQPAQGKEKQRLRAASTLATYDPDSPRWEKVQDLIANDLVGVQSVYLATWLDALRPLREKLQAPLAAIYHDAKRRETERSLATDVLAEYASEQPTILADLLMDADDKQFAVLYPKVKAHGEPGMTALQDVIDRRLLRDAEDDAKERLGKRQANAAVALLRMGRPESAWPVLMHSPDPRARSYLIHRLGPLGADARAVVQRMSQEPDVTIRRALVLSLGELGEKALSPDERDAVMKQLQELYRTADDPGLHGAVEWLLRHWRQDLWLQRENAAWAADNRLRDQKLDHIHKELAKENEKARPQWYINGQGQTMVVLPGPVDFMMGSPSTEAGRDDDEREHEKRIGRTFALAAHAVTLEQFRRLFPSFSHQGMFRMPDPACPILAVLWHEAAQYCNWLSQQEGLPEDQWCYEKDPEGPIPKIEVGQGRVWLKMKVNHLGLAGYRLPTEAEMEYACRAGTVTARYYGETEELLKKYAWYLNNSSERTWPVGSLKPNDYGLFDMHGNIWCWCQDPRPGKYPEARGEQALDDKEEGNLVVRSAVMRGIRGGGYFLQASFVRSAKRNWTIPAVRFDRVGVRPARTIPLGRSTTSSSADSDADGESERAKVVRAAGDALPESPFPEDSVSR